MVLITDIDVALKSMGSNEDYTDQVVLHQLVSKQLGLCLESKAKMLMAVDHFNKSIELCSKVQALKPHNAQNMDLEICDNMLHISICYFRSRQIEKTQQGI